MPICRCRMRSKWPTRRTSPSRTIGGWLQSSAHDPPRHRADAASSGGRSRGCVRRSARRRVRQRSPHPPDSPYGCPAASERRRRQQASARTAPRPAAPQRLPRRRSSPRLERGRRVEEHAGAPIPGLVGVPGRAAGTSPRWASYSLVERSGRLDVHRLTFSPSTRCGTRRPSPHTPPPAAHPAPPLPARRTRTGARRRRTARQASTAPVSACHFRSPSCGISRIAAGHGRDAGQPPIRCDR